MNEQDFLADEIYKRYGNIKRARGAFLYTEKEVRLTDLFQENGKAILGWGGGSAFTMMKNVLSRGLTGTYRTCFGDRVQKAVSDLLGEERKVLFFKDSQSVMNAALQLSPEGCSLWKPWNSGKGEWENASSVIIEPPLPWAQDLFILAVLDTPENSLALSSLDAQNIHIPAALEAAVARSLYDMIQALQTRQEKDWFIYDTVLTKYWTRKGPYLYPKVSRELYSSFILHCLDAGVVINPVYDNPSIVPFGADRGVFAKLEKNPFTMV